MAGYGTDDDFAAWLADNGYELPDGALSSVVLRQRGSQYVDGLYGQRFVGEKAGGWSQERAWPRRDAYVESSLVPDDEIPLPVVHASFEAALQEAREPESLSLIGSAAERVKRAKVEGAVEVEYQASSDTSAFAGEITPVMTAIEGLLAPFLRLVDGGPAILVV